MVFIAGCGGGDSGGGGGGGPAPIANAGQDEAAPVGTAVTLDGSASEAPSGLLTVVRILDLDPIPCDRIVLIPTVRPFGQNALEV
jgi:hypothetical protein